MTRERFKEIELRTKGDQMQLCYELFCEEKSVMNREEFNHMFPLWLNMFRLGGIQQCIEYFKNNKLK